ncbi:MAG: glycosyltransferase family 2 protein [Candidatus Levybacteria bacterium]|nr:glycosyltransferase family 2 protein [Candidatus Levybacteria bacterium]
MSSPKISIVVLNYNGIDDTKKCLESLIKTSYPNFEIIVVDNGSTYNEAGILEKTYRDKRIKFVRFSKNLGFSGGNNKILKDLKSKYVVLLNNDTEVPPGWLFPLVKAMEKDNSIAIAQPKILWLKNKKYFDYAGASGGFIDIFGYPFTRGRIFDTIEKDSDQYNLKCDIFWASGAAMIIRRNVLDKVGFFDEMLFNYMEEIDLCFRVHRAGFRIICEPKSYIYHKVASTASSHMLKKRFWEHRNNLLLILKNYPIKRLLIIFPIRIILEYMSFFYYLKNRKLDYALAVILSQLSLIYFAPVILAKRLNKNINETKAMKDLIYNKSITFSYFVLNKKNYSELP